MYIQNLYIQFMRHDESFIPLSSLLMLIYEQYEINDV